MKKEKKDTKVEKAVEMFRNLKPLDQAIFVSAFFSVIAGLLIVLYTAGPIGVALIALLVIYWAADAEKARTTLQLPSDVLVEAAASFIERAFINLHGRLAVFQDIYCEKIPMAGASESILVPRYNYAFNICNRVPVVTISLLCAQATALPQDVCEQSKRALQGIINDELARGYFPQFPQASFGGLPVLYLLDIHSSGKRVDFHFAYISDKTAVDFVAAHNAPRKSTDTSDDDF